MYGRSFGFFRLFFFSSFARYFSSLVPVILAAPLFLFYTPPRYLSTFCSSSAFSPGFFRAFRVRRCVLICFRSSLAGPRVFLFGIHTLYTCTLFSPILLSIPCASLLSTDVSFLPPFLSTVITALRDSSSSSKCTLRTKKWRKIKFQGAQTR